MTLHRRLNALEVRLAPKVVQALKGALASDGEPRWVRLVDVGGKGVPLLFHRQEGEDWPSLLARASKGRVLRWDLQQDLQRFLEAAEAATLGDSTSAD